MCKWESGGASFVFTNIVADRCFTTIIVEHLDWFYCNNSVDLLKTEISQIQILVLHIRYRTLQMCHKHQSIAILN